MPFQNSSLSIDYRGTSESLMKQILPLRFPVGLPKPVNAHLNDMAKYVDQLLIISIVLSNCLNSINDPVFLHSMLSL